MVMRGLSDSELLDLVDAGRSRSFEERALAVLHVVTGEAIEALAALPRARLEGLLIQARAHTIGPRLDAGVACGHCGTLLEATVDCRLLEADPPDAFELACENCGSLSRSAFDIRSFFWRELAARARRILIDVHELAAAYGWRESDVLSLSPLRRRRYLELIAEPRPLELPLDDDGADDPRPAGAAAPHAPGSEEPPTANEIGRHAVLEVSAIASASVPTSERPLANRSGDERSRHHDDARSTRGELRHVRAAMPARVLAAAPRPDTLSPPVPPRASPQVTVNIARIDVVTASVGTAVIGTHRTRRDAGMPLSAYLADRETGTR